METKHLKKWVREMVNCTQCGYCKEVCPVFDQVGWDSSVARGKMSLAYGLYIGDIEPDEGFTVTLSNPVGATISDGPTVAAPVNAESARETSSCTRTSIRSPSSLHPWLLRES